MSENLPVPTEQAEKSDEQKRTGKKPAADPEGRMTFIEHLSELRDRIMWAGGSFIVAFILCYALSDYIFKGLQKPLTPIAALQETEEVEGAVPLRLVSALTDPTPLAVLENKETKNQATYEVGDEPLAGVTVEHIQDDVVVLSSEGQLTALRIGEGESIGEGRTIKWGIFNPLEWVFLKLKLAAYGGLVIALPVIVYQICRFIFPGLTGVEKRAVSILLVGCSILVLLGFSVAYFAIFPLVLPYLMAWVPDDVELTLRANETVSILVKGLLAFSVAFQFPMVVLVLVYMGIMTPETLKKYRKVAYVGLAVMSAFFTPPDPISMMIMLAPLALLYEISILVSHLVMRRKASVE